MSKQVDNYVASMEFDNSKFEKNVATSMSTLEKLKQKLNLDGASKGLEEINAAAGKVNMSGLGSGVDAVKAKFSALDVVAVTALANITNKAVDAGEKLVKSLSVDQVSSGWDKYAQKTTSVQTLINSTGKSLDEINEYLDKLMWYSDETSYGFTDMTSALATMTSSGGDIEKLIPMIEGVANATAFAGKGASEFSTVMKYGINQAYAMGYMLTKDWMSIENATVNSKQLIESLIAAGEEIGTIEKGAVTLENFRTSLADKWLTSDVMEAGFGQFAKVTEEIYEGVKNETFKNYADGLEQIGDKYGEVASRAAASAQEAKTFTEAIDATKDAVSSQWMTTFELIFGDYEKAKVLWTELAETLWDVFAAGGKIRNKILKSALGKSFSSLSDTLSGIKKNFESVGKAVSTVTDPIKTVTKTLEDYNNVVNEVIRGDWGHTQERWNALTEAGYDWITVQNMVNEKLGNSYRRQTDYVIGQESMTESTEKTTEANAEYIATLTKLSDAELKALGLTDEQIEAIKEVRKQADKLGMTVEDFLANIDEIDGRWVLINSFKNVWAGLVKVFEAVKAAWEEIFPPKTTEEKAEKLYDIIAAVHKFTTKLIMSDDTAAKVTRTFKGLFAVLDLVRTVLGGGLRIAVNLVSKVLGAFDLDILEVTARIGDVLVKFREWALEGNVLVKAFDKLIAKLPTLIEKFQDWFAVFKQTPAVQKLIDAITAIREAFSKLTSGEINISEFARILGENLAKALKSLPGIAMQIASDFIAGFQNGISDSVGGIINDIVSFCLNFVSAFAEALGVQSPSWKAYEIICDFFQGAINAAKDIIGSVIDILKKIGEQIVKVFKSFWDFITDESGNIEWGKIFAGGSIVAMIWVLKQIATAFNGIANALGGIDDLLANAGKVLKSFSKVLNGIAWDLKAQALQKMAIAIAILVASIWVLTTIDDPGMLRQAVVVIAILAGILVGLALAMEKLGSASVDLDAKSKKLNIKGIQNSIIQIGLAILLIAAAVKLIGGMDPNEAKQGFIGLAGIAVGMVVFLKAISKMTGFDKDISSVGTMMKKLAVAMILMVVACKLVSMLSAEDMLQGAAFAAGFAIFVIAITKVAKSAGNNVSKVGGMVLKLTVAMALMVGVCKLAGSLSAEEMLKGAAFAAAFVLFVKALVKATKIGKKQQIASLGSLILSVSVSLLLMVGVCKLVGKLTVGEMVKGAIFVAAFVVLLKSLVKILTIGNEQQIAKVAGTILAMSAAIAILAGVAVLLGFMPIGGLAKGIIAVGLLSVMMTRMIKALKGAQNAKGAIMMMAIAIGVMAASVVALSFIDTQSLIASAGAMTIMMAAFALMVKSMKGIKDVNLAPLIALSVVTILLAAIVARLSHRIKDPTSAIASVGALVILMGAMAGLLLVINSMKNIEGVGTKILALTAMAIPLLAFSIVLRQMNGTENAMGNVLALTVLMTAMTVLLAAVSLVGQYLLAGIIPGIASLTAMVIPMMAFVEVLKQMDGIEDASGKIESLTTMMTTMTLLLAVLAVVGLGGPAAVIGIGSLVVLFAAIGALAVAIGALMEKFPSIQKFLDTGLPVLEQLAGSIGTMIGKFIGGIGEGLSDSLVKMGEDIAEFMDKLAEASDNASGIKGESFDGVKQLMDVMGDIALTTVGTTIGDIFTLGGTSMEKFQKDGVAFFDAMKAIGEASSGVDIDAESMRSVIGVAQKLADLQSSLEPIGGVISWFTGRDDLATFGTNAGQFVSSMVTAFGSLGDANLDTESMNSVIGAATSLAELQSSLEPIGGVISWFTGRDDLGTFGVNVGAFVTSMVTAFGSLDSVSLNTEAMDSIISAATSLAGLQSSLEPIGGAISWFTGRDDLGTFGVNVGAFITSMVTAFGSLVDVEFNTEAMDSIISAATSLAELQSSLEPIGGVISWFTGRDDLGTFGVNVGAFIGSMKTALATLDGATLNEESLTSVITAASKLADLQSKLEPMGGVISWFTGRSDLGTFGTNIGLFADAMGKLKTGMGENGISEEVVASVINAGNAIIELQKALPEEGWFDGKMNLSEFSDYVTDFATAMSTFSSKATEIESGAISTVINTAYRIKSLIESLVDLDTSGVDAFTGIGSGGIGADGPAYDIACAIAKFGKKVADIDTEAVTVAVTAAKKLKTLIGSLVGLDTSGIENFKPDEIGKQMKNYADKVAGIDVGTVSSSISSANRLKNFISGLVGLDTSGITKFKPESIGSALKTYGGSVSGTNIGAISSSISAANRLKSFISGLTGLNTSGVGSFKTAVDQLATVNIAGLVKAFSGASTKLQSAGGDMINGLIKGMQSKTSAVTTVSTNIATSAHKAITSKAAAFATAGGNLATKLASGFSSKKGVVNSAVSACLSSAASKIRDKYTAFYNAGSYLVTGFSNGISENTYKSTAKAKAMAEAAVKAAREALKINSPSKVFREIGSGVPEGFAQGIGMLGGEVKKSVTTMASTAINTTRSAMATVLEALNSDMDTQPTIRPVVDLSDVQSGAAAIHGMFDGVQTVGVRSNLSAINATMNARLQNGTNDDIISAINKLNAGLENNRGDTYSIAGITYDDGSAISDAVKTIARYAIRERRV